MPKWIWTSINPPDRSIPPAYWLHSTDFQECATIRRFHTEWHDQKESINFWSWIEKTYPVFFTSGYAQKILANKKIRTNYLKSIIRKAATFYRGSKKIGMHETSWLESMDPKHRNSIFLEDIFKVWLSDKKSTLNLWQWLDSHKFDSIRTEYLNAYQRQQYLLRYDTHKGLIYRGEEKEPFDTTDLDSNDDHAMFVMDTNHQICVREENRLRFKHSSFLSGKQVLAAGMIKILAGKIHSIDDNSGHYRTLAKNLEAAITFIPRSVFMDGCIVQCRSDPRSMRMSSRVIVQTLENTQQQIINRLLHLLNDSLSKNNQSHHFLRCTQVLKTDQRRLDSLKKLFVVVTVKAKKYLCHPNDQRYYIFRERLTFLIQESTYAHILALKGLTLKDIMINGSSSKIAFAANYLNYILNRVLVKEKVVMAKFNKAKNHLIQDLSIFKKYCAELLNAIDQKHHDSIISTKGLKSMALTVLYTKTKPKNQDASAMTTKGWRPTPL